MASKCVQDYSVPLSIFEHQHQDTIRVGRHMIHLDRSTNWFEDCSAISVPNSEKLGHFIRVNFQTTEKVLKALEHVLLEGTLPDTLDSNEEWMDLWIICERLGHREACQSIPMLKLSK